MWPLMYILYLDLRAGSIYDIGERRTRMTIPKASPPQNGGSWWRTLAVALIAVCAVIVTGELTVVRNMRDQLAEIKVDIASMPHEVPPTWFVDRVDRLETRLDQIEDILGQIRDR